MIEIDGSHGEGGGQIVRTAVALSAVTGKAVRIRNIRRGRPRPGLAPQHIKAVEALASISQARFDGVYPGSGEVTFEPGEIKGGRYDIDIGTAGSVSLLVQCLLPATVRADGDVLLHVRGGTDVKWSPSVDYLMHVALPAFSAFGVNAKIHRHHRGYYPKGGGLISVEVRPGDLRAATLTPTKAGVRGVSHCSNLPEHVAERQAKSATKTLEEAGYEAEVTLEVSRELSTGSGITLWSGSKGASALGERGLQAEVVGRKAAEELLRELERSTTSVDVHLADQLIPFIALAGGSFTTAEVSLHTSTNIWTAGHFLDTAVEVTEVAGKVGGVFRVKGSPGH